MPNHVATICTVTGSAEDLAVFRAAHLPMVGECQGFDFDTIIPRPECIKATESSSTADDGFYALTGLLPSNFSWGRHPFQGMPGAHQLTTVEEYRAWLETTNPKAIEGGKAQLKAFRETGHRTWYDWCIEEWGTKWGAYDVEIRDTAPALAFKFETAWNFPEPIFRKLAEMYPGLVFSIVSYDEGGNFACEGAFNGANDYRRVKATPSLYLAVYGRDEETEEEETAPAQ